MSDFNFSQFTNQYSLSKTLRFELKPVGKTQKMLEDNNVFKTDEKIAESYKEAKKWFDLLHREFINTSLEEAKLSKELLENFEAQYFVWKGAKTNKNFQEREKSAKSLRTEVLNQFRNKIEDWQDDYLKFLKNKKEKLVNKKEIKEIEGKIKKLKDNIKNLELLFKVEVFDFLRLKYPEAQNTEGESLFSPFNKFSGYFKKFHKTRENFYKDEGKSGQIPTRIINDNLIKFLENKKLYEEKYKEKHEEIFSEEDKSIFTIEYFNNCFSQHQIDDYNDKIAELKSKINEFRQDNPEIKKTDLPFFKTLFKQILGESKKHQTEQDDFIQITDNKDVFPTLQKFIIENKTHISQAQTLFEKFITSQKTKNDDFEIAEIYVAGRFLNTISNKWFASWSTLRVILREELKLKKDQKELPDFISIQSLKNALLKAQAEIEAKDFFREDYKEFFNQENFYQVFITIWESEFLENIETYKTETENIDQMIKNDKEYQPDKKGILHNGEAGKVHNEKILDYASSALAIYQMMKYFSLEKGKERDWNPDGLDEDQKGDFYGEFHKYYNQVETWKYFNEFRNYLTKKPYSTDKFKVNLDDSYLLSGWSQTYSTNAGLIFRQQGKYYLGVINGTGLSEEEIKKLSVDIDDKNSCQRMLYDFQKPDFKNFPRLFVYSINKPDRKQFAPAVEKYDLPINDILEIYNKGLYKTENRENPNFRESLSKMIDYFKLGVSRHESYKHFTFSWEDDSSQYSNISDFYRDVERSCYSISWEILNFDALKSLSQQEKIYLFQVYNKDFELDKSIAPENYVFKGGKKENLHTTYWKAMFSEKNLEKTILKLNGEAELFFRKKSLEEEIDEKRKTKRKVVNNKRYTKDKILFHCPITLNFAENNEQIDKKLRSEVLLKDNKVNSEINIIGIDRGEKHLAYYSVVNQSGEILDIGSFNKIKEREDREATDYHQKLDKLEKNRDWQRKSWQEVENIKEMKKGYISQVVHQICKLIRKYNAIVVFEDLNIGFKRGRFAIEKQIYQNLELALAKKLNYLVFKDAEESEEGHHLKALQLTPPVQNFQDINKQCGIMFYIPASYTSAICPVCGFRKNISTPIKNLEENKKLIKNFSIFYEAENDRFKISYEKGDFYKDEKKNKKENMVVLFEEKEEKNEFEFFSDVERLKYQRNKDNRSGEVKDRNPNQELKDLFEKNKIDFRNNPNISDQINNGNFDNENFYKPLIYIFSLMLQLRNSKTVKNSDGITNEKESRDFISCPVCHFHSENNLNGFEVKYIGEKDFEFNGDANGAFNIARKGALVLQKLEKIQEVKKDVESIDYIDLTITQEEWDKFTQR